MNTALALAERGLAPTPALRWGIRRLVRRRLDDERRRAGESPGSPIDRWLEEMRRGPVALVPDAANDQHYELPPEFFAACLGPRLKYSGCLFESDASTLAEAEEAMLLRSAERARLADGQRILELGCGWGSLTLWAAERFPGSHVTAVSNSAAQRRFVEARARERGLANVRVRTADMNDFDPGARFDRVVSVEMFEHMRDWETLLRRVRGWLEDDGRLFVHVFTHRELPYPFEDRDASDWMSRTFFTGGMMPSHDLLVRVDAPFEVEEDRVVNGTHYARTAAAWRGNLEARREEILPVLRRTYGPDARVWYHRWRLFFLACEELFGYAGGREWRVSHYRLRPTETER